MNSMKWKKYRKFFGDPILSNSDLVAYGGDFDIDRLIYAYSNGIFPWSDRPICWYCLDPRAVFDVSNFHVSRTIKKKIKKNLFEITVNQSFLEVMKNCAMRREGGTWITDGFFEGYFNLHKAGFAHSIEAWNSSKQLVGGVYGVAIDRFFAGESMFAIESDAGKVALTYLFSALERDGFVLFDTQELNSVTQNLGAFEISKAAYLKRLKLAIHSIKPWVPNFQNLYETMV